ncbi:MAG: hypothetical protein ACI9WS_002202 [Paraglaciecola psychrophila]|jgi:uncharacterized protein YacL (UPF0231 family)
MDYEFTLDEYDRPVAEFSMGFEALGNWFSMELGSDEQAVDELLNIVQQLLDGRINERALYGSESQLHLNILEVAVMPLEMEREFDLPEETQLFDDGSYASCGLPDFHQSLLAWQQFVQL